ncbi:MAG: hypothetical protein Kow0062_14050 [Acidobacteriota bacterium]
MNRRRTIALVCLSLAAAPVLAAAGSTATGKWLHVRVEDRSGDGESVRVNLPLDLIATILPEIDVAPHIRDGRVVIAPEQGVELGDLRAIWQQVRQAADGEYVRVDGTDEQVRVRKAGRFLEVDVHEGGAEQAATEKVAVRMPLEVLDALFSAPEGEVDLAAAIEALAASDLGELVRVEDGESTVRVWIDDSPEAP